MPAPSTETNLLTTLDLADRWKVSAGALANDRSAGIGPRFVKLGYRVRYRLEDVVAYESLRVVGTDEQGRGSQREDKLEAVPAGVGR